MSRNITYIGPFDVSLQDRDGCVTLHVCTSEMREFHALPERKGLLESVNCDVLARMETTLLNELMGMTGRGAEGQMFGEEVVSISTFSMGYFHSILSADSAKRCHRVLSRRFRSGS
jgi:hypothetical protein